MKTSINTGIKKYATRQATPVQARRTRCCSAHCRTVISALFPKASTRAPEVGRMYALDRAGLQTTECCFATVVPLPASSPSKPRRQPSLKAVKSADQGCYQHPQPADHDQLPESQ